jgi:predicted permease
MSQWFQELRRAVRSLARSRGFAGVAVVTLALGIGAATAVFTLLDRIVLRPLPYPDAGRLVRLDSPVPGVGADDRWGMSEAGFLYVRQHSRTLEGVGAYASRPANLSSGRGAERVTLGVATLSLFDVVRARPAQGRLFVEAEGAPGSEPAAVVLGHGLWMRAFGGDPAVVGSTVKLNAHPMRVVGVMEPGTHLPTQQVDVWMPLPVSTAGPFYNDHNLSVVARMRPGATLEGVRRELSVLTARLPAAYPEVYAESFMRETRFGTDAVPLRDYVLGGVERVLWVLAGSVALVLLIASVNVANLFLVRAAGRRRDTAVRTALGAGRRHLVRGAAAEGVVVALAGGALGAVLAAWAVRLLVRLAPPGVPRLAEVSLDGRSVAVAFALALCAGVAMGVFPVLRTPLDTGALRGSGRGQTASRRDHALRGALVAGQLAVALVLLAAAGLMLRSFERLRGVHPGFDAAGATLVEMSLPYQGYKDHEAVGRFYADLLQRASALPGVVAAGAATQLPLEGGGCSALFVEGRPLASGAEPPCIESVVAAPGYFRSMGIPVRGRETTWEENARGAEAVVITRALAERLWPGQDPIGRGVRGGGDRPPFFRVVGVTGDLRAAGLDQPPAEAVFYPMVPARGLTRWGAPRAVTLVLRTRPGQPAPLAELRRVLREMDPDVPVGRVRTVDEVVAASPAVARTSFTLMLLGTGSAMALLLSVVGLYGVVSYTVRQRTGEVGLRMALGARGTDVAALLMRQSLRLVAIGVAAGLVLSLAATRMLSSLLFGVTPADPLNLAAVSLLLIAVAMLAAYLPARRAARVDPMVALRAE